MSFCRRPTLPGRTDSVRASTLRLRSLRVASMSALIWSGLFVIGCPRFLPARRGSVLAVWVVLGSPLTDRSSDRPATVRMALIAAQIAATTSADQPRPVTSRVAEGGSRQAIAHGVWVAIARGQGPGANRVARTVARRCSAARGQHIRARTGGARPVLGVVATRDSVPVAGSATGQRPRRFYQRADSRVCQC